MIRVLTVSALLLASPALAQTSSAVPEAAFVNTVVSVYPDGRTAKLWLEPDGTYRGQGRRGKPSSGKWSVKGQEICLKQLRPFPAPFRYCTEIRQGGVGTSWTGKAVTGEPVRIELIAGR
jgi:hypothetical protein